MGSIGVDINTLTDEASENISDINNENAEHQSNLEDAADTVQTVQETTDFAESFDESTRLMCFVEAALKQQMLYQAPKLQEILLDLQVHLGVQAPGLMHSQQWQQLEPA